MTIQQLLLGGEGAFSASPSFNAPLTNTLVPTTALGGSGLSYARASVAYMADWEGLLKICRVDEPRFIGARRVENLVATTSQNLANAAWTKTNGGTGTLAVATANFATDPLGGSTASRLQVTKGAGETTSDYSIAQQSVTVGAGAKHYLVSLYMKANSGTPNVHFRCADSTNFSGSSSGVTVTLTGGWVRYTTNLHTFAAVETAAIVSIGVFGNAYSYGQATTTACDILVWGVQLELVSGQTNQNPGEYISVGVLSSPYHGSNVDGVKHFATLNGNTVASNIVTEATGAAITSANGSAVTTDASGPLGVLIEGATTTTMLSPETFGSWSTISNGTVTSDNIAGPNGLTTADRFNENAATASHELGITPGKASASALPYTFSVYAKYIGRQFLRLQILDGTTNSAIGVFDIQTGVVGTTSVTNFTSISTRIEAAFNGYYRCIITATTPATTGMSVFISSAGALGSTSTSIVGLNGSAYYLFGAQVEQSAFVTSYLPSSTSTRPYDGFSYSTFATNADATVGTAYAETKTQWTTAGGVYPLLTFGVATLYPLYSNSEVSTTIRSNDGTNNTAKTGLTDMNTAVRKRAVSWTGSTMLVTGDGVAPTVGSFDGNMGSTAIGLGNPTTGTGVVWNGNIRNVKIYTTAATAGQLATLTT